MDSLSNQLPPETDLCKIPTSVPPPGQSFDPDNTDLRSLTICLGVILTTIAVVFGLGRLYANFRKLTAGDFFVFVAIISNTSTVVLMIIYAKYFRHIWDIPLCWINDNFGKIAYAWEMTATFSTFPGRAATLLLFYQLFTISRSIGIAIWIGMAISLIITVWSICILSYGYANEKTRDHPDDADGIITMWILRWSLLGGTLDILIDIYIFILPLPIIFKLNLSKKKKLQVSAIFFIALLGIAVSILTLAYRIKAVQSNNFDSTYNTGVVMICSLVQMNVTLIICSTPAFVGFIRLHVLESQAFKAFQSILRAGSSVPSRSTLFKSWQSPNRPRTGRDESQNKKGKSLRNTAESAEVSDTCLLNSGATIDIDGQRNTLVVGGENKENDIHLKVLGTEDIEHSSGCSASLPP
ncbi:hypothetical protein F5Y00DRAFT_268999 [Daldinia vernicosa]|uniref:uncharacterized protein n=1 Tax=Daldinia vernicosa TaxID=114800 RepID=UPI002008D160|nr:uncharacterized protein F5Y00DRAFT_268999 [Daldinia vernicosa]KAI0849584.1 hypothetical protein F5Y00DRAFT_268999 [Daldinia vernicosa]